jgi:TonB family protein
MTTRIRTLLVVGCLARVAAPASAQETLDHARALYTSAEYEGALSLLAGGIRPGASFEIEADVLRVSCLMALGRTGEADAVIRQTVTAHPEYVPGADLSPRVRAAFQAVRDRVLPALARRLYDEGRSAFGRGALADAVALFEQGLPVIEALAREGGAGMEDLRVLANGFLALGRERVVPPPVGPPPLAARATTPQPIAAVAASLEPPQSAPIAIRQDLPPWDYVVGGPEAAFRGAVDVRIDEAGRVVDAVIAAPVHPLYDNALLHAARKWRYEPARRGGRAVTAQKRVEVELRAR